MISAKALKTLLQNLSTSGSSEGLALDSTVSSGLSGLALDATLASGLTQRVTTTTHLASATLPAASAFTSQDMYTIPAGIKTVLFYVTYTRGATNGQVQLKPVLGNGTQNGQDLLYYTPTISAPNATQPAYFNLINSPVPSSDSAITFLIRVDVSGGATKVALYASEIGVAGTPGTCSITLTASA